MLFNTATDGDSSSTFHCYCEGIFPTVTIILDTKGNKFRGYSTTSWSQSTVGASKQDLQVLLFLIYQINKKMNYLTIS